MKESTNLGMKTFDQSLFELYQAGEISYEDALRYADSANEVRLRIKLAQGGDARTLSQGLAGVEVAEAHRSSAEPRVGKECVSPRPSRRSPTPPHTHPPHHHHTPHLPPTPPP